MASLSSEDLEVVCKDRHVKGRLLGVIQGSRARVWKRGLRGDPVEALHGAVLRVKISLRRTGKEERKETERIHLL